MNEKASSTSGSTASGWLPLLLDATLDELRVGLDSGSFTSLDLVRAYLGRINEVNWRLRAVTEINPDALSIAFELDYERRRAKEDSSSEGSKLGPLHGVPVLLKNNIATDDKTNTTAGSYALLGARVPEDSTVAAKLREAGAIILGKANMSQWASCRMGENVEGWSALGGQTFGAYFPNQSPKATSSGSAVGTSIGLAWASLGTDTGGAITMPASQNNVVGFRPTVGLTSRHLVIPYSERLDTVGTLTRTVKDAAYLMVAIAGRDGKDSYTARIPFGAIPNYVAACKATGLQGKRIGVARSFMSQSRLLTYDLPIGEFDEALQLMRAAGARILDDVQLAGPAARVVTEQIRPRCPPVAMDFATDLPKYLEKLKTNPNNIRSLRDLREFTQQTPEEQYPKFSTELWDAVLAQKANDGPPRPVQGAADDDGCLGDDGIAGAFERLRLDALVAWGPEASMLSARIGLPVVTVPLGKLPWFAPIVEGVNGLIDTAPNKPFGISFVGPAFGEETLFEIAYAFEQLTQVRKTVHPYMVPKTELADILKP
ncbi:amidase-like protein [Trichoderma cornu-damae]|uniref:Amidase-like protein n=1 Tax=Trichoderma cornu-damae TaxID=654480 RepID=A0A9P8QLD0_9HYPO|nr:amidase-like protein [Trichoderma cornu-damae]